MYIGRIVAAGMTRDGRVAAGYRVSSRSFPNRTARLTCDKVAVMPRAGFEGDLAKNPYIAYNCLRLSGKIALVTNGSQTDPIIEKIMSGMNLRDALALPMLALDYEHDSLNTPRISAAVDAERKVAMLGIVRHDALLVREFPLEPGKIYYLSTYEKNAPCARNCDESFDAADADALCAYMISGGVFADFEKPVTAAAALWDGSAYRLAAADAKVEA
ncbi:MAG: IMP cyclohydrolase [Lentisphaeria bacterium]|nr:IMP cyclohydrolase [Lentisphaeria bacterium]